MRTLLRSSLVLAALLVSACSHSPAETNEDEAKKDAAPPPSTAVADGPADGPAAEPEPEPAADAVVEELSLTPSELREIADGAKLEHCLDCMRQASTYNYCEFDKSAFTAAIGDASADEQLRLRVTMVRQSQSNFVPDDPNAPQPDGGFTHIRHVCTVDAVLPPS